MSKDAIVIVLGLVVAAMPFLGFPSTWETVLLVALGVSIAVLVFLFRREMFEREHRPKQTRAALEAHVENGVGTGVTPIHTKGSESHEQKAN